jgi:hypothetical protein
MRFRVVGLGSFGIALPALLAIYSCGSGSNNKLLGLPGTPDTQAGVPTMDGGTTTDATNPYEFQDVGPLGDTAPPVPFMDASFAAPDCPSCMFPPMNAPACPVTTPPIQVVYPADNVLVPPNMNVISVQWTPFGTPFQQFEVDFENSVTDMRVVTACAAQTMDTEQPSQASGGCELQLDPTMWNFIANQNRGGDPVLITVRGTVDGMCATTSANGTHLSFAQEDLLGALYYWKSTVSSNGTGGQIWVKSFGDDNPETNVTGGLGTTCNGCHALSRDGARMVINSDDDDSDDEYTDVTGSLIDMTTLMAIGGFRSQEPGFSTFYPDHTQYVSSNGLAEPPTNIFKLWNGDTAVAGPTVSNLGAAGARPTMPDWSPDGKTLLYVMPTLVGSWDSNSRNDDAHVFGGSLYTAPYLGNQMFGAPTPLLMSNGGDNNYYPGYSPDGQLVVFDHAAAATSVTTIDGCTGTSPQVSCPNDSFSNPAARLMVVSADGGTPIDLALANGSPTSAPVPVSNSWPKWSPFLQSYKGSKLLWVAFSSTRDYGVRVRNHQTGQYQCYPPDSFMLPGAAHHSSFAAECQQPQLWMAAINVTQSEVMTSTVPDPSNVAFWLPFQDITTHNHTPQWTQAVANAPIPDAGACIMQGGSCVTDPTGCCAPLICLGDGTCGQLAQ